MIAVEVSAFGGPEVLRVVDRPPPVPAAGEVLVRVEACGLNWSDLLQRDGLYPGGPKPPFVAGQEAAGVVVGHGPGVTAPPIGAKVSVIAHGGGLAAELAAVPAASCLAWPGEVEMLQRAALPIALVTAHHALAIAGRAAAGETCVIHAAAGGLGSVAVQVARLLGLRTVATCSPEKRAHVVADRVCGIAELAAAVPDGADVVLDGVGGEAFRTSVAVLRPFGRVVIVGASSGKPQRIDPIKLVHRAQSVVGVHLRAVMQRPDLLAPSLAACVPWALGGQVRARVEVMPLREMAAAHEKLAGRRVIGKLVLGV